MTFDDLRAEYESPEHIGEHIWALLIEVTGNVCRRYPARIYADDSTWTAEAVQDLAQSVALERLLGEGQLDYMFSIAADDPTSGVTTIKGLMGHQVQRTLAHRRAPTVVDRLVVRIRGLLAHGDLSVAYEQIGREHWLYGTPLEPSRRELTPAERRRGRRVIAAVPIIPSNPGGQRESKIYAKPQLILVVERLVEEFGGIYLSDIRRILEELLTAWLPEILYDSDARDPVADKILDDDEMRELSENAAAVVAQLSDDQVTVMVGKSNGVADSELAKALGCSRPTVIKHKRALGEIVETELLVATPADNHPVGLELLIEHALIRMGGDTSERA